MESQYQYSIYHHGLLAKGPREAGAAMGKFIDYPGQEA